jgi:hypothetical protein
MATATVQTVWDCRWSRAGHQITGLSDALQPEPTWVCVRDGDRRAVCGEECASCSRWEAATASAAIPMSMAQGAILTDRITETLAGPTPAELAQVMVRVELVCLALVFIGIGLTVLTTPASVAFTVALWLCAAPFLGLAVFGHFRE